MKSYIWLLLPLASSDHPTPEFPITYSASIIFQVPYVLLDLPIHIQSDGKVQLVQYFDGLASEFISGPDGLIYREVYNITDRICIDESPQADKHSEAPEVKLVEIFPDLSQFNYTGSVVVRGLQCDQYTKLVDRPGEVENFYYDPRLRIPVRWTMHSREEIFDSHIDDYIVDYVSVRPLEHSLGVLPAACREPSNRVVLTTSTMQPGSLLRSVLTGGSRRRRSRDTPFALGYLPREDSPRIQVFGDSIPLQDLLSTDDVVLPASFDWRSHNGAPAAKDQAFCGSCYAFSVIGAIESALLVKSGGRQYVKLSEQFLLDCGWSSGAASCSGGNQQELGPLVLERFNGFIPLDSEYGQYLSTYSYCKNTTGMRGATVAGWVNLPSRSSVDLIKKTIVQNGILAVSINAVDDILFYTGGIVRTDDCRHTRTESLNHAVNLVGYGVDDESGVEYWILRNSWSSNWGDDQGYFKVEMGDRDCGVSIDVSFPIVNGRAATPNKRDYTLVA